MLKPFLPQTIGIGGLEFNIYGLFLGLGTLVVLNTIYERFKSKLTTSDYVLLLITTLVGARGLFLAHNIYRVIAGNLSIFEFSLGGLALYGGLVGLLIGAVIVSFRRRIPLLKLTDTLLLNLPLAQSVGRVGNFFNSELYGKPTNVAWSVHIPEENRLAGYESYSTFHPVFLYEIVLNLFNWAILRRLAKSKRVKEGTITFTYILIYGLIRLLMNTLRIDKEFFLGLETSDILSILFIGISSFSLFIIYANNKYEKVIAEIVSWSLNAYAAMILPILVAIYIDIQNIAQPGLLAAGIILIPFGLVLFFYKFRLINDFDISDRSKRPLFMVCLTLLYLLFYYLVLSTQSIVLIKISLSLLIISTFFTIISTFWKISGHMTYLLFAITSINFIFENPYLLYLYLLVPLVAWSRVRLNHHTPMQTVIGTAAAMIMCLTFFYLI